MAKINDMLRNWESLNEALMDGNEALAVKLLAAECEGERRITFLRRIQSRINKLRGLREMQVVGRG